MDGSSTGATGEPLPADAVALLEVLLQADTPAFRALRAQIPHLRVTGRCPCPCPTLDFGLDEEAGAAVTAAPVTGTPAAEATVLDAAGEPVGGIMVFTTDGFLSGLELYDWLDEKLTRFPTPDRLRLS